MIIDSHAHYIRKNFDGSFRFLMAEKGAFRIKEGTRETILNDMRASGIAASVEPGVELESNEALLKFCREHPGTVFPAVGVHPTRVFPLRWKDRKTIDCLSKDPLVVAIGETGLDYHYERKDQHRLRQLFWFRHQIRLADRRKLPLILHIRMAHRDALRVLRLNRKKLHGGVAHCFSGSAREVEELVELGFSIGIGGALLHDGEQRTVLEEAVRRTPLEKILVETDAPYVLPTFQDEFVSKKAKRKIRNTSLILPAVIRRIAELKEMDEPEVERAVCINTMKVFGLHSLEKAISGSPADGEGC